MIRRNTIRIVCNPYSERISYHFKNEFDEWDVLSGNSPLSRQYYTNTTMKLRALEIAKKIDEVYNRKNKGLDILFEGTAESFLELKRAIDDMPERNITCSVGTTKIAVLGKKHVGKTSLIEGLEELHGYEYSKERCEGYEKYSDECHHAEWFEIDGIDLGRENVETAFSTLKQLSKEGVTSIIYCVSGSTGRIEEIEKELISKITSQFSQITPMIVLTNCYMADLQTLYDQIEKVTDQIKIAQTLAKPYKTSIKDSTGHTVVIDSYGLEQVSKYVFEGR